MLVLTNLSSYLMSKRWCKRLSLRTWIQGCISRLTMLSRRCMISTESSLYFTR